MSGAGAGLEVRICVGLGRWDSGSPTRWVVTIGCAPYLQRCVCNEQQRNQRRAHGRKIHEDMHNLAPTVQAPQQLSGSNYLRSAIDSSSWTMDSQTYTSV